MGDSVAIKWEEIQEQEKEEIKKIISEMFTNLKDESLKDRGNDGVEYVLVNPKIVSIFNIKKLLGVGIAYQKLNKVTDIKDEDNNGYTTDFDRVTFKEYISKDKEDLSKVEEQYELEISSDKNWEAKKDLIERARQSKE